MLISLFNWITCNMPHAKDIAKNDMEEAERQMLQHEAQALYHTKMTEYYRITYYRLNGYISPSK